MRNQERRRKRSPTQGCPRRRLTGLTTLAVLCLIRLANADIPQMISYQGRVTDNSGVPVADGTYDMRFRIYDHETAGNLKWDSGSQSVQVEGGVFNVLLGESPHPPVNLDFDVDYWLLVTFDGVNQSPRQRFASVGYAYMASGLVPGTDIAGSIPSGGVVDFVNTSASGISSGIYAASSSTGGSQGVYGEHTATVGGGRGVFGKTSSTGGCGVYGWAAATSGTNYGVYGQSASTSGRGVYGHVSATSGTAYGGRFESASTSGRGVHGAATATSGTNYGGRFLSNSTSGTGAYGEAPWRGVRGAATSSTGTGVYGSASATTGFTEGGWFESASTSGKGVVGSATALSGVTAGVYGEVASTTDNARGVYGRALATDGDTFGGYFTNVSPSGAGVYGEGSATTGDSYGVYAVTRSPSGRAVYAEATATSGFPVAVFAKSPKTGVEAQAFGSNGCGVSGSSNTNDGVGVSGSGAVAIEGRGRQCGGYFEDTDSYVLALVANDTYSFWGTGSKLFVQNHPERKDRIVAYAALEGDEVGTYTRGTARLVEGETTVPLGETFKWVTNPDIGLTAHLTPRGDCRGLYVASLTTREMTVRELGGGTSDASFDYLVIGLRIGFEEQSIVQEKQIEAYIPSMASHRERYDTDPELRKYNALERFKVMRTASGSNEPLDFRASEALRDAVREYDPAVHGAVESPLRRARRVLKETEPVAAPERRRRHEGQEQDGMAEREPCRSEKERMEMTRLLDTSEQAGPSRDVGAALGPGERR